MAFDFEDLFVVDLANNHEGRVEHALAIIDAIGQVARVCSARVAVKFQFRQLETFIHPRARGRDDNKHIARFQRTELALDDYRVLVARVREQSLLPICTPFDESSVGMIERLGIGVIKIASCSATDWPLIARVASAGRPVIASTAGASLREIARMVDELRAGSVPSLALMHCVALYPTPHDKLRLGRIVTLRERFPRTTVGFSTHESPENMSAIQIAYGLGARLFERHVGLPLADRPLNAYSSTPQQIERWIVAHREAKSACETGDGATAEELVSLRSLQRGVYARQPLQRGMALRRDDVSFAMPLTKGQLAVSDYDSAARAGRDYEAGEAIEARDVRR